LIYKDGKICGYAVFLAVFFSKNQAEIRLLIRLPRILSRIFRIRARGKSRMWISVRDGTVEVQVIYTYEECSEVMGRLSTSSGNYGLYHLKSTKIKALTKFFDNQRT
jgi:hypothetical protein